MRKDRLYFEKRFITTGIEIFGETQNRLFFEIYSKRANNTLYYIGRILLAFTEDKMDILLMIEDLGWIDIPNDCENYNKYFKKLFEALENKGFC